jgi:Flp pilus assembly protein TadD
MKPPTNADRRRRLGIFIVVALVTLAVYLPTLKYGFVWDDNDLIRNNEFLTRTNPIDIFTKGFWHNPVYVEVELSYYRPLVNLSFYFERQFWGLNPTGYHLTNVLIHAVSVLLICLILYELFGSIALAALGGLLLGVHPAWNCAVTFISNRTYLLAQFMLLAAFYCLLRSVRPQSAVRNPQSAFRWPVLGALAYLGAMLSLESGALFGIIALVWLAVAVRRQEGEGTGSFVRRLAPIVLPILAAPLAYLFLRFVVARVPLPPSGFKMGLEHPLRFLNAFGQQALALVWPFSQKVLYANGPVFDNLSGYTLPGVIGLILPPALWLLVRNRRREAGAKSLGIGTWRFGTSGRFWLGLVWFLVFLLPFGHLLTMGPAGRMLYIAAPGVLLFAAALAAELAPGIHKARRWLPIALFAGVLLLIPFTLQRNALWNGEATLYKAAASEAPDSPMGLLAQGDSLMGAGKADAAIAAFRRAVKANPDYAPPHEMLARALMTRQDFSGAIVELRELVRIEPNSTPAYTSLGVCFAQVGELDSAVAAFREVVDLEPNSAQARNNLALALKQTGALNEAVAEYQTALRLEPQAAGTWNNLGSALMAQGDTRWAIAAFKEALRLSPGLEAARENLIQAWREAGFPDSAARVRP